MEIHHIVPQELWASGGILSPYSFGSAFGKEHNDNKINLYNHNGSHNYYTGKIKDAVVIIIENNKNITEKKRHREAVLEGLKMLANELERFLGNIDKVYACGKEVPLDNLFESNFYKYKLESTPKASEETARKNKKDFEEIIFKYESSWLDL